MPRFMKLIIKVFAFILSMTVLTVAGFLLFLRITEYKPVPAERLTVKGTGEKLPEGQRNFTFFTWNIGYGGLGKEMDFFYDGGTQTRPDKIKFHDYIQGIEKTIRQNDTTDFIFLQEIDVRSKRSYFMDEKSTIFNILPNHCSSFAGNYNCRYVPFPFKDPMGKVVSGLATISKFQPSIAERISFPTDFSWPKHLFFLKRCFLVTRYPLTGGKQLVVINTHNSTYDDEGILRKTELSTLHKFMTIEFSKGNYVIAGGDWNNNPRGFDPKKINTGDAVKIIEPLIDTSFLPGWRFVFDTLSPTNRDVSIPYSKGKTKTTIIDFFIVSPNIEIQFIKTLVNNFEYSDHNPVIMKIVLR